ncbi:hypothetical protein CQR51_1661 [Bifidobacterium pseudolongum subsp. globosum]|nr:hypothetical protein CQR51_1661 [Bifidobacterium pseudolongum subsp. globosum]
MLKTKTTIDKVFSFCRMEITNIFIYSPRIITFEHLYHFTDIIFGRCHLMWHPRHK